MAEYIKLKGRRQQLSIVVVAIVASFVLLGGYFFMNNQPASGLALGTSTVDLLDGDWQYMPGAYPAPNGLHINYLGRAIVAQDGTPGQLNPAVNLYGTRLKTDGTFTLTASLSSLQGTASLRLYASPPIIQDEFRVETPSLEVTVSADRLTTSVWGAYNNQNLYDQTPTKKTYYLPSQKIKTLTLDHSKATTRVLINGQQIAVVPTSPAFVDDVWIGLAAVAPGDSWNLESLEVQGEGVSAATSVQTVSPLSPQGLQSLATERRKGFLIGAAMRLGPAVADPQYAKLAFGGNFGQMTMENALKWQYIHPQPGVYDFSEADALVALAKKNNIKVHGHTLVFAEANPQWVRALPVLTTADRSNIEYVMVEHIRQTMKHFGDSIGSWDVINEPLADYDGPAGVDGLRQHLWYRAMGPAYLTAALREARAANPNAKLYINEYGLEVDGDRWTTFLSLVKRLKAQGVPLDGVGFQAHVYEEGDEIDPTVLRRHIHELAKLGLASRVSEMDVYSANGAAVQAQQYAGVLQACLVEPSCVSWTTWGITDRYNLWADDSNRLRHGQDFLWNRSAQPTPAQIQLRQILASEQR